MAVHQEIRIRRTQYCPEYKSGFRYEGRAFGFWGLAVLLGVSAVVIPITVLSDGSSELKNFFGICMLFLGGAILGYCRPANAWRWFLGAAFGLVLAEVVISLGNLYSEDLYLGSFTLDATLVTFLVNHLSQNGQEYLLKTFPVLAASYLGSSLSS